MCTYEILIYMLSCFLNQVFVFAVIKAKVFTSLFMQIGMQAFFAGIGWFPSTVNPILPWQKSPLASTASPRCILCLHNRVKTQVQITSLQKLAWPSWVGSWASGARGAFWQIDMWKIGVWLISQPKKSFFFSPWYVKQFKEFTRAKRVQLILHTGAKTKFLSRNYQEFDVWKMWILWKIRLWKCGSYKNEASTMWILWKMNLWKCDLFCQKWDFQNVSFFG